MSPHRDGHDKNHEPWEDDYLRGYKDGFAQARTESRAELARLVKEHTSAEVIEKMRVFLLASK